MKHPNPSEGWATIKVKNNARGWAEIQTKTGAKRHIRAAPSSHVARARTLADEDLEETLIEYLSICRILMLEIYRRGEAKRTAEARGFQTRSS